MKPLEQLEYSESFRAMIVHHLRGMESWPNYQNYLKFGLGGPEGRVVRFANDLCPEIAYHCGDVSQMRALDFGCGTGCTTVGLVQCFKETVGFDIDSEAVEVARQRLREHGLEDRVEFVAAKDIEDVLDRLGTFDFILVNGVIEHIPLTMTEERRRTVSQLSKLINPKGFLYINDTPNRLWPKDVHSTQLWWIPWMRPGSPRAYRRAVRKGRHSDTPTTTQGPRGLEEVGAWGATYWEIREYLKGKGFACLNIRRGHDRHIRHVSRGGGKRALVDAVFYIPTVRFLRAPIVAFSPFLNHLVFQKI